MRRNLADPGTHHKSMRSIRNTASKATTQTPRTGNFQNSAALAEFIKDPGAFTFTGDKGLLTFFDEPEPPDIGSEDGSPNDAEQ